MNYASSPSIAAQHEPAALRKVFGENLRALCAQHPSVAGICRELKINRTQFNRYLSGESFPRPDVLSQICHYFGVDARILLEPINSLKARNIDLLNHPVLSGFFGSGPVHVDDKIFPSGFYRFVRRSFIDDDQFVLGLVYVKRDAGYTFLRGYEPRDALRMQGLSTHPQSREYRGMVMRQEDGIMAIVSHRNSMSCSFNFLTQETSFQSNLWEGYATRTTREQVTGRRATRMVYEYIGHDTAAVMKSARQAGLVPQEDVAPFHIRLLRLEQEFR
ncbi:helix-turn-helix transcriptional regulator [Roseovarius sp. EL26]|uniref:helix-turn-helix domain-containing protein n=1 Tax=Roseovarius sp. EL26 TaxID=2126672 RepID=UPI0020B10C3D|nr:helix-turn-helix transcriptional regulator [Roseovarius sp. EL26]